MIDTILTLEEAARLLGVHDEMAETYYHEEEEAMSHPVSKKLGYVTAGEVATMIYQVLPGRGLRCEGCGRGMTGGEPFTRRGMKGGGPRLFPFCRECEPFGNPTR